MLKDFPRPVQRSAVRQADVPGAARPGVEVPRQRDALGREQTAARSGSVWDRPPYPTCLAATLALLRRLSTQNTRTATTWSSPRSLPSAAACCSFRSRTCPPPPGTTRTCARSAASCSRAALCLAEGRSRAVDSGHAGRERSALEPNRSCSPSTARAVAARRAISSRRVVVSAPFPGVPDISSTPPRGADAGHVPVPWDRDFGPQRPSLPPPLSRAGATRRRRISSGRCPASRSPR